MDKFDQAIFEFKDAHQIKRTRENYLDVLIMGTPPEVLDAEEEAALPEEFRLAAPRDWEEFE